MSVDALQTFRLDRLRRSPADDNHEAPNPEAFAKTMAKDCFGHRGYIHVVSSLAVHLDRLSVWLRRESSAPTWRDMRLIEARHVEWSAVSTIPRSAVHSATEYEGRFEALLAAGYAWLNLSALGVLDQELLVCVELPRDAVGAYGRTSVNLSGPPLDRAGAPVWDASLRYRIV